MSEAPQFVADKSIVLVGLMGAGKTTIGRRLATRLGLGFQDADSEIEKAAHCSIPDIFEAHGESAFRDLERRVITRLLAQPPHVLATGGGAFMDAETRQLIAESGTSLWLRADIDILLKRVARRHTRPLLERGDRREILEALIAERYPIYAEADVIVDSMDVPHDVMVDRVVAALERHFAHPVATAAEAGA